MSNMFFDRPEAYYVENTCINTAREIDQQPETWRKLADSLASRKEEIAAFMNKVLAIPGLRIVTTGAGSSAFIGEAMQYMLANEMGARTENVHTTDFVSMPDSTFYDVPTLLISYARSGESAESVATIRFAEKKISELYQVIIVCDKNSSLGRYGYASDNCLVLDMPAETCDKGFAMTSSVSNMILATWCLFHYEELEKYAEYVRVIAAFIEDNFRMLDNAAREVAKVDYRRIIWLGCGALKGLAREGAVKSMELTNGYTHAGYDAPTGFRHGPKTVIDDDTVTIHFLSNQPYTLQYDVDFANEMTGEKEKNVIVTLADESAKGLVANADYEFFFKLPEVLPTKSEMGVYIADLMFTQLLAMEKSLALGYTTDNPCPGGQVNRVVKGIIIHEFD